MDCRYHYRSPLGWITMRSDGEHLTGLWFDGQKYFPRTLPAENVECAYLFDEARAWLDQYFSGHVPAFMPKIHLSGTDFRERVWKILLSIPYGQTMTYGDIAKRVAEEYAVESMSAQAVGNAVGHNPISIIVPCHRVIAANGSLTGYAGGIERKRILLSIEQSGGRFNPDSLLNVASISE